MKKLSIFLVILGIFMVGCGKKNEPIIVSPVTKIENKTTASEFDGAPEWVLNPTAVEGYTLAAVGSAEMGKAGLSFAKVEASAAARDEIARTIQIKVNNLIKRFTQQTGIGNESVVDKVTADVSKQVTSQYLSGSMQKSMWISKSNTLYVLVAIDENIKDEFISEIKERTRTSYKNDEALWQQFQAQKAQDELDAAVMGEFE